jgi:hypothetical protein
MNTVLGFKSAVALAFLLVAAPLVWASEPTSADGDAGTVCHIKVLSNRVPDVSSLEAWKKAFIKDGMSDQEKALAVWKSVAAFQYQDAPAPVEFIHHEDGMYDPIKMFNVYGYGICCYASAHVEALGRYVGLGARGWGINCHSVCELQFDNTWHLIDSSLVTYFPKEDGKLASVQEMTDGINEWYKQNPSLMNGKHGDDAKLRKFQREDNDTAWKTKGPAVISRSPTYDKIGWWPAGSHGWYSTMQEYDGTGGGAGGKSFIYEYGASLGYELNLQLRKGEKIVRNWGNKGLHVQMDSSGGAAPESIKNTGFFTRAESFMGNLDPNLKSYANGRIGNGTHEYNVPLANGEFKRGALLVDNLASTSEDKAAPAVHLKDAAGPGVLILRMPSSYVYLSGKAEFKAVVGDGGEITVDISQNNGLDWTNIQKLTSSGDVNLDLKDRVYRRYDYRLRFTLKGKGTGLDTLKITHDIQHSQRPLPALGEGENKIAFSAGPQESTITIAANTLLDAHKGKQIEYTDYHAQVQNAQPNGVKIEGGKEGIVTVPIETPGEMTRLKLWASYRTWGDDDAVEFRVSYDDGKTFKKVGDGPAQKFGRTAYCVVSDVPAGTKKALIQYVGLRKTYMVISAFRADADYKDKSFGFRPVKVTYEWEENGAAKKDEHVAAGPDDAYTIKCGVAPKMKSITLELAD